METLLGIPMEGWKALTLWGIVILFPWTYSVIFIRKINKSGVARWGAKKNHSEDKGVSQ